MDETRAETGVWQPQRIACAGSRRSWAVRVIAHSLRPIEMTEQELPEAPRLLDLPKGGLDHLPSKAAAAVNPPGAGGAHQVHVSCRGRPAESAPP